MSQRTSVVVDGGSIEIDREHKEVTLTFTVIGSFTPITLSTLNQAAFMCVQPYVPLKGGYVAERWRLVAVGDCVRVAAIMRAATASAECNLEARQSEIDLANNL